MRPMSKRRKRKMKERKMNGGRKEGRKEKKGKMKRWNGFISRQLLYAKIRSFLKTSCDQIVNIPRTPC